MQRILNKKMGRELRKNWLRYLALAAIIVLSMYLIVSLLGAADTILIGTAAHAAANHVEDGQFTVFVPLTKAEEGLLTECGLKLEKMFYLDYTLADESVLRVFRVRKEIDLAEVETGAMPVGGAEIALEKRYCEEHDLHPGDSITVAGRRLRVSGVVTTPDYDSVLRSMGDSTVDSVNFGPAYVSDSLYVTLAATGRSLQSEEYLYAYLLDGKLTNDELKELLKSFRFSPESVDDPFFQAYWKENYGKRDELLDGARDLARGNGDLSAALEELEEELGGRDYPMLRSFLTQESLDDLHELSDGVKELADGSEELRDVIEELVEKFFDSNLTNLRSFVPAADNPRIGAAAGDVIINKYASLAAGVIIIALLAYVISVFVIHSIERERSVIGTLYALGLRHGDLLRHYLTLPVLICFAAGLIGTVIGYSDWGVPLQTADSYAYYSVPAIDTVYELPVVLYGVVMPPVIAALVNFVVIRKKLSVPALQMIRGGEKHRDVSRLDLGNLGFIQRFQLRQMLREGRSALGVVLGIFVCLLLMMIGINAYTMCDHVGQDNIHDTRYEYMYLYKYPEEEVPKGGAAAYAETMKKEALGYNMDVTILGLGENNPFFDARPPKSQNRVQISSAMAQKYGLREGEQFLVSDEQNDRAYAFTVDKVVTYAPAFFVFMDIDSMRELFGADDEYFNVVFSDRDLHIDPGRLYSVSTRSDVIKSADVFVNLMVGMVSTMIVASAAIMGIVMYLMMKVMIDRSAMNIALFKVFGFRSREISRLYLHGNTVLIALGTLIAIPLAKILMDAMYPYLVANVACAINLHIEPWIYGGIFAGTMAVYGLIHVFLTGRLRKISHGEILKNRE